MCAAPVLPWALQIHRHPILVVQGVVHEVVALLTNLHGFDLTRSTPLPAGWTYDEKNNEFILRETQDWWSYEDGFLVRNHVWGKNTTYKPEEFPIDASFLQTTTGLTLQQGSRTIHVNAKEQQHFHEHWAGKTLY